MHSDDLFTAPQVAKLCSTDLKTIHNWVNRGEIKFFRTPGRHLRFRRQDIVEFLDRFGYPIPTGFAPERPRVVIIDSDEGTLRGLKRTLTKDVEVEVFHDHFDALLAIGRARPSLVLVNGGNGPEMTQVIERLAARPETAGQIAVYGKQSEAQRKRATSAGAVEFIADTDTRQIRRRVMSIVKPNL
jgi:excisionase family DNA binding protein